MIKKGVYAAGLSVLNDDLSLNVNETIAHAEDLIYNGLHGVIFFGSTGQSQLISLSEKKSLISKIGSHKLKKHFFIGTGSNSLKENIDLIKYAMEYEFKDFLIMPPAYYKYRDSEVIEFYKRIVESVPESKIILYNFEKLCGYKFSLECVEELARRFPNQIVGVKDSSYNLYENLKLDNFSIFPGSEQKLLAGLELGCSGIITATCNVTAELSRRVYDDFFSKKKQLYNQKLCDVRTIFDKYNLISGLHSFCSQENEIYKNVLPPLSVLNQDDKKDLINSLKNLNFSNKIPLAA